ncbi:MAG: HD domain-containing protein [Candidatus Woesearchaeota archaeon]|nr:MAG: HD domain-containing protein [Candidatus Woesearchaeota archaeon]
MVQDVNAIGKDFFMSTWGDPALALHCRCVIEACLGMAKETDLNQDVFILAGWIHDVGRKDDVANHEQVSCDYLENFLNINSQFRPLEREIKDCILHHRSSGKPETLFGQIFKAADKVALRNSKWLAYKNSFST